MWLNPVQHHLSMLIRILPVNWHTEDAKRSATAPTPYCTPPDLPSGGVEASQHKNGHNQAHWSHNLTELSNTETKTSPTTSAISQVDLTACLPARTGYRWNRRSRARAALVNLMITTDRLYGSTFCSFHAASTLHTWGSFKPAHSSVPKNLGPTFTVWDQQLCGFDRHGRATSTAFM